MPGFLPWRPVGEQVGRAGVGGPAADPTWPSLPSVSSLVLYFSSCKRGHPVRPHRRPKIHSGAPCGRTVGLRAGGEGGGSREGTCPRPRRHEWLAGDPPGSARLTDDPLTPRMGHSRRWPPGRARPWALPRRPQGGACRLEEVTAGHLLPLGRLLCSPENAPPGRTRQQGLGRVREGGRGQARVRAPSTAAGPS